MRALARRTIGLLRAAGVALLALELVYLIGINVFLSSHRLFEKVIDATPEVVDVHYLRAWSLLPTRIHAEGLDIRGTDSHVEWILHLDEVDFECSLLALARMRFTVARARGNGVTFRARLKVLSPEATAERMDRVPPIDSLGPVAFVPDQPPYEGTWDDAKWHLWTIRIDDAVADHVRELWVEGMRFQGDARIAGSFFLRPIRAAEVGPAHIDIRSGSAAIDARTVAESIAGAVDFKLERFDPRVVSDADLIHHVSLSADAHAVVPDLDDLALALPDSGQIWGKVEVPRLTLRIAKGVLRDGTHLDAHGAAVRVSTAAHVVSGAVDLTADVSHDRLVVGAVLDRVDADFALSVPRASVSGDSAALDIAAPFADAHGIVDAPDIELPDARRVMDYLPKGAPARVTGGEARCSLHVEGWLKEERVRGSASLHAKDVELRAKRIRLKGRADVEAFAKVLLDGDRATATLRALAPGAGLTYDGRHLTAALSAHGQVHSERWRSGALSLDEARVEVAHLVLSDPANPSALTIEHASVAATSPRFVLSDPLADIELVGNVGEGRVKAPSALRDLLPAGSLAVSSVAPETGGSFGGDLAVRVERHVARGAASIHARGIGAVVGKISLEGDFGAIGNIARWDLRRKTLQGDVAITMRNVTGGLDPPGSRVGRPDFAASAIDARASAAELDLAHPTMRGVDYGLRVDGAQVPDARALNTFLPDPAILAIESGAATLTADIGTSGAAHAAGGRVDVSLRDAGVRLHQTHLAGDFAVQVKARAFEPERSEVDLEGSRVAMRNVRVTGASTDTSAWAGDLVLQEGTLALSPVPRLAGDVTLQARDASPLLAVLLGDSLPKFLAALTRMPRLDAATHLVVEPDTLAVTDLVATGGDLTMRGVYVLHKDDRRAAFVIQKGPWSAGIRFDRGGSYLRLFGLDGWYREQRDLAHNMSRANSTR